MAGGAFSGVAVLSFVGRPSGRRTRWRAPTIAVRSVRSGLPLPHPRCRLPAAAFGFPRAHRGCPPPGLPVRGATDFEACRAARSVCRAWNLQGCPSRPRGRSRWASGQLKVGRVRCARVGIGFLLFPHVGGGAVVVGAAESGLRVANRSRRPQTVLVRAGVQWQRVWVQVCLGGNASRSGHVFNGECVATQARLQWQRDLALVCLGSKASRSGHVSNGECVATLACFQRKQSRRSHTR